MWNLPGPGIARVSHAGRQILNQWVTRAPSVPLLTPRIFSSDPPNTTALPPWTLCIPCLRPTLAPLLPLRHPAPIYSSPAPWRVPSCLISDCGPALLPQWLQTCKLPYTFCSYTFFNEIWTPTSETGLIFQACLYSLACRLSALESHIVLPYRVTLLLHSIF